MLRAAMLQAIKLADIDVDFDCPRGLAWETAPENVPAIVPPAFIAQREEICEDCPNHSMTTGKCSLGCKTCSLSKPESQCPDNPPRWLPVVPQ